MHPIRYLINAIVIGLLLVSYYVVVAQLTPIHRSMLKEVPDGLTCDYYNATIIARSPTPVSWRCSSGDLFSEPFPSIAAILAVGTALFVLRFTVPGLAPNYLPSFFVGFFFVALGGAIAVRLVFLIQGTANFLYGLWTMPLVAAFLLSKFYIDRRLKRMSANSSAERYRRHKVDLSAGVEITERIKERETNGGT